MTQTSKCNDARRLYAHKGVLVLTPSGPNVKFHMITGDNSYSVLNPDDVRVLTGLLVGELVRMAAETEDQ